MTGGEPLSSEGGAGGRDLATPPAVLIDGPSLREGTDRQSMECGASVRAVPEYCTTGGS